MMGGASHRLEGRVAHALDGDEESLTAIDLANHADGRRTVGDGLARGLEIGPGEEVRGLAQVPDLAARDEPRHEEMGRPAVAHRAPRGRKAVGIANQIERRHQRCHHRQ